MIADGNEPDQQARARVVVRRRGLCTESTKSTVAAGGWLGATYRQRRLVDCAPDIQPRCDDAGSGGQWRADIKVHKDGTTWLVDVSGVP